MTAPLALGLNGNAVVVSNDLHRAIADAGTGDLGDPVASGHALARVIAARRQQGAEPLVFGMVFPFSSHNYQLRYWMAAAGSIPTAMCVSWCCRRPMWRMRSPRGS
ncbi:MAG: ABC transporter substrate-binding protein [Rhodospirillaceae bacterium]|nr:ABC transporter substrate-binding protein [Rhodospirillaceae bacterium]